jgi:hypothetical protein
MIRSRTPSAMKALTKAAAGSVAVEAYPDSAETPASVGFMLSA